MISYNESVQKISQLRTVSHPAIIHQQGHLGEARRFLRCCVDGTPHRSPHNHNRIGRHIQGHTYKGFPVVVHNVDKRALRVIVGYKGLVPVQLVLAEHLSSLCTVAASPSQAWPAPSCVLRALLWYR